MPGKEPTPITIDQLVEATSAGVLRALGARDISAAEFARGNGFRVGIHIEAGGFPVAERVAGLNASAVQQTSG